MRKINLTFLFILCIGFGATAQLFTIGPKVGLTSSQLNIKETASNLETGDAQFGYHAGLFARITIAGFYVQPEAYFHGINGSYIDPSAGGDQTVNIDRNQVDIPILFGMKFAKIARINVGPVASFATGDIKFDNQNAQSFQDDYRNSMYGFQAGVGLDIKSLTLDLRYEGNFGSISEMANESQRFSHVLFSIGYKIIN